MAKIGIVLTARTDSERLPSKILLPVKGDVSCFEFQLRHLIKSKYPVVVAVPFRDSKKDILKKIAKKYDIPVYENPDIDDEDVLGRIVRCAKEFGFDHIGRITHDDIFFDHELFDGLVDWHLKNKADHTSCPQAQRGIDSEVMSVKALELAESHTAQLKRREHVTYYIKRPPFKFIEMPLNFRLALDYETDYETIKKVAGFHDGEFSYNDLRKIFLKNPDLVRSNRLPKVSVFIPCKDYGRYLDKVISSILTQTIQDIELILVDDGSKDDTWGIMNRYDHAKKIRNEKSVGLIKIMNHISSFCRGEYVIRVDADDWLEPNALEIMSEWLDRNRSYQAVYSDFYTHWDNSGVTHLTKSDQLEIPHPACSLVRLNALNDVRVNEGLACRDGWDFWLKFRQRFMVGYIPEPLWHYRKHGDSLSQKQEALETEKKIIIDNLKDLLNGRNEPDKKGKV